MKKNSKKGILFLLLIMMSLLLISCGKESNLGSQQDHNKEYEYIYVPEFTTLEISEDMYLYNLIFENEDLYFISSSYDDQEAEAYKEALYHMNLATMEKEILPIEFVGQEGRMTSIMKLVRDQQGNTYVIYMTYPPYDENTYNNQDYYYYISKYDSNYIELYTEDISDMMMEDDENRYVQNVSIDGNGYLYLSAENCIRILSENGFVSQF